MHNRWSVFKDFVHYWTVQVNPATPAMLASFLDTMRHAGLVTGVYRREPVNDAPDGWTPGPGSMRWRRPG